MAYFYHLIFPFLSKNFISPLNASLSIAFIIFRASMINAFVLFFFMWRYLTSLIFTRPE